MTTTTAQDNGTLCKNCNAPLGHHIIPQNNCPTGPGFYLAEQFFTPVDDAEEPTLKDRFNRMAATLECIISEMEKLNKTLANNLKE